MLIISKTDLVEPSEVARLSAILRTLNRGAKIVPISGGEIDLDHVLNTGLFDFERAQQAPGWLREMRGEHSPWKDEYGIGSFTFTARRPFHPEKFYELLHNTEQFGKLLRSKGYFFG